jgi:hypothetical protein
MTKSTKAILLSAFVYPGAGQVFLKRYISGIIFIGISTIGLYFIVANAVKIALQIVDQIRSGNAPPDFITLLNLVSQHDTQLLNNAFILIMVTWLISIIHAYLLGKHQQVHLN